MGTVGTFSFTALGAPGTLATLGLVDGDDFFGSSFVNKMPTGSSPSMSTGPV